MPNSEALPESFIEQVKEALEKLYDFQALQQNSLSRNFDSQLKFLHRASERLRSGGES